MKVTYFYYAWILANRSMSDSLIYGLCYCFVEAYTATGGLIMRKRVGFSISKESQDDLILTNYPIRLLQISDKTISIQVTHVE